MLIDGLADVQVEVVTGIELLKRQFCDGVVPEPGDELVKAIFLLVYESSSCDKFAWGQR